MTVRRGTDHYSDTDTDSLSSMSNIEICLSTEKKKPHVETTIPNIHTYDKLIKSNTVSLFCHSMGHMHTQNSQVFITTYLLLLVVMVFPMPQVLDLIMAQPALCFVWQEN